MCLCDQDGCNGNAVQDTHSEDLADIKSHKKLLDEVQKSILNSTMLNQACDGKINMELQNQILLQVLLILLIHFQ